MEDPMDALLGCTDCPRLAGSLAAIRSAHPDYHARPVLPFGDTNARLLIVGLAPGMHGANRSGRPFTGDEAGVPLYETLHEFDFANRSQSLASDDGLVLTDCRITNAVKCLPPENKPKGDEVNTCNRYLKRELEGPPSVRVVLALGAVAHGAVLMAHGLPKRPKNAFTFAHLARHELPDDRVLLDSYHPSGRNMRTGLLTRECFREVFRRIRAELGAL
jgi:uracil-DNA glycosylase family 4